MALDPTLAAAFASDAFTLFHAVKVTLPSDTIRLLDSSGAVSFNTGTGSELFTGEDAKFGSIGSLDPISESAEAEAPRARLTILPPGLAGLSALTDPAAQGAGVTIWLGAVDQATGLSIGAPEVVFVGELDTAQVDLDLNVRAVTLDLMSVWERLFEVEEGQRLTPSFHKSVYPGELLFDFAAEAMNDPYWGANPPVGRNAVFTGGGSGGGMAGGAGPWVPVLSV